MLSSQQLNYILIPFSCSLFWKVVFSTEVFPENHNTIKNPRALSNLAVKYIPIKTRNHKTNHFTNAQQILQSDNDSMNESP